MSEVQMSRFIFSVPPRSAFNRFEEGSFVIQRQAYRIIESASLSPEWKTTEELLEINDSDLSKIYVLYEFVGEVFLHLSEIKCRIISSLVVLQSHKYELNFPIRTTPTWAQTLHGQIISAIESRDMAIRLGGAYKRSVGAETTIIIVGIFNPDDSWFKTAVEVGTPILQKRWLEKVYKSANNLECQSEQFFDPAYLRQYQLPNPDTVDEQTKQMSYVEFNPLTDSSGRDQFGKERPSRMHRTSIDFDEMWDNEFDQLQSGTQSSRLELPRGKESNQNNVQNCQSANGGELFQSSMHTARSSHSGTNTSAANNVQNSTDYPMMAKAHAKAMHVPTSYQSLLLKPHIKPPRTILLHRLMPLENSFSSSSFLRRINKTSNQSGVQTNTSSYSRTHQVPHRISVRDFIALPRDDRESHLRSLRNNTSSSSNTSKSPRQSSVRRSIALPNNDDELRQNSTHNDTPISPIPSTPNTTELTTRTQTLRTSRFLREFQTSSNQSTENILPDQVDFTSPDAQRVSMDMNSLELHQNEDQTYDRRKSAESNPRPLNNTTRRPSDYLFPHKRSWNLNIRQMGLNKTNFRDTQIDTTEMHDSSIDDCLNNAFVKNARLPTTIQPNVAMLSNPDVQPRQQVVNGQLRNTSTIEKESSAGLIFTRPKNRPRTRQILGFQLPNNLSPSNMTSDNTTSSNRLDSAPSTNSPDTEDTCMVQSSSPQCLSQGPLLDLSNCKYKPQGRGITWEEGQELPSQLPSRFFNNDSQGKIENSRANKTACTTFNHDLFIDSEEQELFNRMCRKSNQK
ncbi:hypothetical protein M3Y97_00478300 [Aphelenchoides bicaudatus]|nr:hypothetical protein M3Y97_00478300 [Aphelenchoides bicaudatus]